MEFNKLRNLAETSDVLTEEIFNTLVEFMGYNSTGMRVTVTEILTIVKERIEKNEKIKFFKTNENLTIETFKTIILENFGEEVFEDTFGIELN